MDEIFSFQPALPGLEPYFKQSTWKPRAALLERLQAYLRGYALNDREIRPTRQYIADKCGFRSVRNLARYLAYLRDTGWLKTVCRKAYTAIRKVVADVSVPSPVPSLPLQDSTGLKSTRKVDSSPLVIFVRRVVGKAFSSKFKTQPQKPPEPKVCWGEVAELIRKGVNTQEAILRCTR